MEILKDLRTLGLKSRGLRNNNPGNLVESSKVESKAIHWAGRIPMDDPDHGPEKKFVVFRDLISGIRAMAMDIRGDIVSDQGTLRLLIGGTPAKGFKDGYSPASDNNDVSAYLAHLKMFTGLEPDQQIALDGDVLFNILKGIIYKENLASEVKHVHDGDIKAGVDSLGYVMSIPFKVNDDDLKLGKYSLAIIIIFFLMWILNSD